MKFSVAAIFILYLLCFTNQSFAQEKSPVKFGKISPEEFDLSKYNVDTSASAVVISDVGSSKFEGNSKGWFTLVFKHQLRIKIINKNGFDAANVEIPLYSNGTDEEVLDNLKAYTYNLENGQVVTTQLSSDAIFKNKLSRNRVNRKFTFPSVKAGSIIEYSYTILSDFLFNLQPWSFQGEYPRIWSEYNVSIPEFFSYVTLGQGYHPYFIKDRSQSNQTFSVRVPGGTSSDNVFSLPANLTNYRWVIKNVPALKQEEFTSTLKNHVTRLEFQLAQYRFPDMPVKDIMGTWQTVSAKMLESEDFGAALNKNNNWLDDEMKTIIGNATDPLEKAKRIYSFVRDNFNCTDYSDVTLNKPLKTIFKLKNGSVSDINLLLIAMLHHQNIQADPVILSTRSHGFANIYPLMNKFNYVIAEVNIGDKIIYLDASRSLLGFGYLPSYCYNGSARKISSETNLIDLPADSLHEKKLTTVFIFCDEKGNVDGTFKSTPGYYESLEIREKIKDKGEKDFFKKIKTDYNSSIEILEPGIDSLKITEQRLAIHYDFKINDMSESLIYFNPMMGEGLKNNLFKSAERKYPVEMPYTFDETYIFTMQIPKNYSVEEIPKSARVSLNNGDGSFEYLIEKSEDQIQLRSRIIMNRANFAAEDYNSLRDFFGYVVKKHSEQIVLKKISNP